MITETSKTWSLYRIANKINGKVYIGQAINIFKRWYDHRKAVRLNQPTQVIHRAMIKHGIDNFEFEVIASCKNQDDANYLETELVKQHDSFTNGYNATLGGVNAPKTEEWKRKISQSLMGHPVSKETLLKLSESHKGQQIGNTHRLGMMPWNKGVPWSEEAKQKQRKLTKEQISSILEDVRSSRTLAKIYGVEKSTILKVRKDFGTKE